MMVVVTGGSGSGKSAYGEAKVMSLPAEKRIYLATMIPWDEECRRKIDRHRTIRAEKNFETIEKYRDIQEVSLPKHSTVLLECLSNLTANEMFGGGQAPEEKIAAGIDHLKKQSDNLVVITNEVFSDGISYDRETEEYLRILGNLNCRLAAAADEVVEVVWGIPVRLK